MTIATRKQEKRQYQGRDLADIIKHTDQGKNVMYQLPTGGGKSVVAADFVHHHHDKRIITLAHRRELILDMESRLSTDKITPSVFVGDIQKDNDSNILIGSVQTLSRSKRLETLLAEPFDYALVDEGHHLRTPTYDKILNHLREVNPNIIILALTATPWRSDKKDFREYIDTLITSETVDSLIAQGYLAKFRTFVTTIGDIDKEVEKNENDYNITSLSRYMRQDIYLQHLVDQYVAKGENRQGLIFAVDKLHLQVVKQKFIDNGLISIEDITAETPSAKRDKVLKDYREKKLKFIISIGTLTEGTDLPDTGCLIVARPTQSLVMFHQILGRGMRPKSDGSDLIILDCAGFTKAHGSVNSPRVWSLDPTSDPKQKTRRSKIVGKRADGTYSDDIKEIEEGDLEVVEMSPEEYIAHSSNAIEEAEKYNEKVDDEITVLFKVFIEKLSQLINLLDLGEQAEMSENNFKRKNLTFSLDKSIGEGYTVQFKKVGDYLIPEGNKPYSYGGDNNPLGSLKLNKVVGELSTKMLTDKKYLEDYNVLQKETKKLQEGKIDIEALKASKKAFQLEQFEISVAKMLTTSTSLYAVKTQKWAEEEDRKVADAKEKGRYYYRNDNGWLFHVSSEVPSGPTYCDEIVLEKGKLLGWNSVIFKMNGHVRHTMSALEKPRLLAILQTSAGISKVKQVEEIEN